LSTCAPGGTSFPLDERQVSKRALGMVFRQDWRAVFGVPSAQHGQRPRRAVRQFHRGRRPSDAERRSPSIRQRITNQPNNVGSYSRSAQPQGQLTRPIVPFHEILKAGRDVPVLQIQQPTTSWAMSSETSRDIVNSILDDWRGRQLNRAISLCSIDAVRPLSHSIMTAFQVAPMTVRTKSSP
jgi:hypothetical protein